MCSIRNNHSGFTLVEIAIAVAILGVALVTLVGLQTRMLDTYFDERNRVKAALMAQYLMAMIEILPDSPDVGSEEKDLVDVLEEAGYFDKEGFEQPEDSYKTWRYRREVTSIALPLSGQDLVEDAMRRIDIVIDWGDSEDQTFGLAYYVNTPPAASGAPSAGGQQAGGQTQFGAQ